MKKLAPLVLALSNLAANALPPPRRIPDILREVEIQQREGGAKSEILLGQGGASDKYKDVAASGDVEESHLDQRLDHFSEEVGDVFVTFRQRYFHTSRYVNSDDSEGGANEGDDAASSVLAFLCVGGEGPSLYASVLVDSVHCTGDMVGLAEKLHRERGMDVHLFAIEHRYYGDSFPSQTRRRRGVGYLRGGEGADEEADEEFDVDYSHLSSRQAVEDVIAFVKSPEVLDRIGSEDVTWITFGGSYPGMLSAWSHLLHPSAIYAAVSNSAPVQAELDFAGYNERVGKDLADELVGGSKLCERVFREGHEEVVAVLEGRGAEKEEETESPEDGVDHVAKLFNVCGGAEALRSARRNQEAFVGDGLIRVPAQSNDPSCEGEVCNIEKLCGVIVDERSSNPGISSMEVLANVRKLQTNTCEGVDWESYINWLKSPTMGNANDRSWMYQTCAEFGFYMTCNEDSKCPYGRGYHDVSRDLEMCQVVFGIDPDEVKKNVESTLKYYGGWSLTPNTSGQKVGPSSGSGIIVENNGWVLGGQKRILFVNGSVDPWSELSLTQGNSDHPSVIVPGSSHHFWTHDIKGSDGNEIQVARQTIYETVEGWLGVEPVTMGVGRDGMVTIEEQ